MGLKPAAHHKLLIQALQETAEGKIDRLAVRFSQINPRLPAMVSGATPPATASRARGTSWPRHWDWWKSDLLPRLRPGAAIILIMTRWHEDDLAGRLLAEAERGSATGEKTMVRGSGPSGQKPAVSGPFELSTAERIYIY